MSIMENLGSEPFDLGFVVLQVASGYVTESHRKSGLSR